MEDLARYRHDLPLVRGGMFLSDGGMETALIFQEGIELPHFASFVLLSTAEGRRRLLRYYTRYLEIARRHGTGFVLDTATWRANADWGEKLGYDAAALRKVNLDAVDLLTGLRTEYERPQAPVVLNGVIGPRGDGYQAGRNYGRRSGGLSFRPGRRLCRQPSRHDHGSHDDEYRGGDRGRPGRQGP